MMRETDARQVAERELESGENILWVGWPDPSASMKSGIPLVLFGIPWTAFALFWMWGASGFGHPQNPASSGPMLAFPLFGLPFVLIGVGLLSTPYWMAQRAKQSTYAITNRRIMMIQAGKTKSVQSFYAKDIDDLQRTERVDGSGNLIFAQRATINSNNQTQMNTSQFIGIPNVRDVERLVRETFKQS
jgi:hypothetical protein